GEFMTCTGEYPVTQVDVDAGEVVNVAVVTGDDPNGDPIEDSDTERVTIEQAPGIEVDKDAAPGGASNEGDVHTDRFTVTNPANVTTTLISSADPRILPSSPTRRSSDLGEFMTCTGEYPVTQVDVDAGEVVNNAIVTSEDPNGDPVEDGDTERVTIAREPGIE